VARAINIPVAAGERLYTRWEFRSVLERHCVRIIQPDICHTGGIMELKKIATMAETYYVAVQPHNANGPISTLASIHLDATIPNFIIQEFFHPYLERYNQLLTEPIRYEDGYLPLPDRPGWSADIDETAAAKLPPEEKPSSSASMLARYVSG
jgi:galactonate dehydratase